MTSTRWLSFRSRCIFGEGQGGVEEGLEGSGISLGVSGLDWGCGGELSYMYDRRVPNFGFLYGSPINVPTDVWWGQC